MAFGEGRTWSYRGRNRDKADGESRESWTGELTPVADPGGQVCRTCSTPVRREEEHYS